MNFGAFSVPVNGTTSLTFGLSGAAGFKIIGINFNDTLPSGLVVATPNGVTGSCGGGTITATAGSGSVALSGAALNSGSTCSFSVNVTGTTSGDKTNVVEVMGSDAIAPFNAENASAVALLTVAVPPTISKAFGVASLPRNGTTTLSFTI